MTGIFSNIVVLLLVAVFITVAFQQFRLPTILGYLIVGIITGPHALQWVPNMELTHQIAEFGVVFLMFMIGLEFSLARLLSMRHTVFVYGGLEVTFSLLAVAAVGYFIGLTFPQVIVLGTVVAMSSTAIVLKQLTEQLEMNSRHGLNALGILLFQDIAVIPILILTASFAAHDNLTLGKIMLFAMLKASAVVVVMYIIGRRLLPHLFYQVSRVRSEELFTLTALLITLGSAWITYTAGLSLVLGAFLAGLMLGETEFQPQIRADLRPFRDVLLGLFFISIGMELNFFAVIHNWVWVLLLLSALLLYKVILITGIGVFLGRNRAVALRTGIILAQGSEFGFAVLSIALKENILPPDYAQVTLAALVISMACAPLLIRSNAYLANLLFPESVASSINELAARVSETAGSLRDHVIICGYGRVGQNLARVLDGQKIPYIALDLDPARVSLASFAGDNVCYGNAVHPEILAAASLAHARAVVVTFSNIDVSENLLRQIRKSYPKVAIIARSYDEKTAERLLKAGATETVPELLEASLTLATHVLLSLQLPVQRVYKMISKTRSNHYDTLQQVFPGYEESFPLTGSDKAILYPVLLTENSDAIGKRISDLDALSDDVKITMLRRNVQRIFDPSPKTVLEEDDIVVLYGEENKIKPVENKILLGAEAF